MDCTECGFFTSACEMFGLADVGAFVPFLVIGAPDRWVAGVKRLKLKAFLCLMRLMWPILPPLTNSALYAGANRAPMVAGHARRPPHLRALRPAAAAAFAR